MQVSHRKLTDREAWLIATHIPLSDTALQTAGQAIKFGNDINPSLREEITSLAAAVFQSGGRHARALIVDIVSIMMGATIQADAVQEIECGKFMMFLTMAYDKDRFEDVDNNFGVSSVWSFDEYRAMCFKHAFPMFLRAEIETRRLIEIIIQHCMKIRDTPYFHARPWCDLFQCESTACLICIPSSSLILEHNLVELLVERKDLKHKPIPMVCKSWRNAWYEIHKIDKRVVMSQPSPKQRIETVDIVLPDGAMAGDKFSLVTCPVMCPGQFTFVLPQSVSPGTIISLNIPLPAHFVSIDQLFVSALRKTAGAHAQ